MSVPAEHFHIAEIILDITDVSRIVLGRYFLVGITYNFGRMNAAQSNRVEQAMWEMAF